MRRIERQIERQSGIFLRRIRIFVAQNKIRIFKGLGFVCPKQIKDFQGIEIFLPKKIQGFSRDRDFFEADWETWGAAR